MLKGFHMIKKKKTKPVNWPLESVLLTVCPVLSFLRTDPRTFVEDGCFLPMSSETWWILSAHQDRFFRCCTKSGHKAAAFPRAPVFFFFPCNLIYISCWSRFDFWSWACFRWTGTWFSYTQTCIYSSESFPISVITVCSVDVPVLTVGPFRLSIWYVVIHTF